MAVIDVSKKHSHWKDREALWTLYMRSYKGGEAYRDGSYLFKHDSESSHTNKYTLRLQRAFYDNWCALPVDTYIKYIFNNKNPIVRTFDEGSSYPSYIDNFNLRGENANTFMRRLALNTMIYAESYVLVDKPPIDPNAITVFQQKELGLRAYANFISPLSVVNWSIDDITGQYYWVLIEIDYYDNSDPNETPVKEKRYRLWTRNEVFYLDSGGEKIDEPLVHGLGFVPIVYSIYNDVDNDDVPESMLKTIAEINREIYNIDSHYQEEEYKLAFAQLMRQKKGDDWTEADSEFDDDNLSTERYVNYPEGTDPPSYLKFPVDTLVEKRARKNELIQNILRLSHLGGQVGTEAIQAQSGLAMSFAYSDTYAAVSTSSQQLNDVENKIWAIIKAYDSTILSGDINVTYPNQFDVRTASEKESVYKESKAQLTKSPTALVEVDMDWVNQYDFDDDINDNIRTELEQNYNNEIEIDNAINVALTATDGNTDEQTQTELELGEQTPTGEQDVESGEDNIN